MFEFHKDKERYFQIQQEVTVSYIIPFLESASAIKKEMRILEIGCGEAGVLKAFLDLGHVGVGIELSSTRAELARKFLATEIAQGRAGIISRNIYDIDPERDLDDKFDLIILKDVIEHIPDQEKFIRVLHRFLRPGGRVFFGFPPWYMPFGGHQQVCNNRVLSKLPWIHLLPASLYRWVLRLGKEPTSKIEELMEIKKTGISIERFRNIIRRTGFNIYKEAFWLINPIYRWKFKLEARIVWKALTRVTFLRNFYTTALYSVIGVEEDLH